MATKNKSTKSTRRPKGPDYKEVAVDLMTDGVPKVAKAVQDGKLPRSSVMRAISFLESKQAAGTEMIQRQFEAACPKVEGQRGGHRRLPESGEDRGYKADKNQYVKIPAHELAESGEKVVRLQATLADLSKRLSKDTEVILLVAEADIAEATPKKTTRTRAAG